MWMQALGAAGLPLVGERFPLDWERYADANPRGYFESTLVEGIHPYSSTDPVTGVRLDPEQTRHVVVKVLLRGLPVSQLAFLEAVLVTVRHWRAYAGSLQRAAAIFGQDPAKEGLDPYRKWWIDHWTVLEDARMRGYRCRFVTYEDALERPEQLVPDVLRWLQVPCDPEAAGAAIAPELCTRSSPAGVPEPPPAWASAFNELYERIQKGELRDDAFLARMRAFHRELASQGPVSLDRWAQRAGGR